VAILESLCDLPAPFDFVLIDAWKQDYPAYFDLVFPKLAPGGLILADNVTFPSPPGNSGQTSAGHDPLVRLGGYGGDELEVLIVVQDRQVGQLGGRGDDQVWHLPAFEAVAGEEPLYEFRTVDDRGRHIDWQQRSQQ
jgi:hypothetical protein